MLIRWLKPKVREAIVGLAMALYSLHPEKTPTEMLTYSTGLLKKAALAYKEQLTKKV